jgi:hypothetical protein
MFLIISQMRKKIKEIFVMLENRCNFAPRKSCEFFQIFTMMIFEIPIQESDAQ